MPGAADGKNRKASCRDPDAAVPIEKEIEMAQNFDEIIEKAKEKLDELRTQGEGKLDTARTVGRERFDLAKEKLEQAKDEAMEQMRDERT